MEVDSLQKLLKHSVIARIPMKSGGEAIGYQSFKKCFYLFWFFLSVILTFKLFFINLLRSNPNNKISYL
jgi:hypothetical protein